MFSSTSNKSIIGNAPRTCYFDEFAAARNTPGPGSHNPTVSPIKPRTGGAICDTKDTGPKPKMTPGPGSYNANPVHTKSAFTKIGTQSRVDNFVDKNKAVPGPANYNQTANWLTQSHMTFKGKYKHSRNENPGPDSYVTINSTYYQRLPGTKIGRQERKDSFTRLQEYKTPGPGAHIPSFSKQSCLSYSIVGKPQVKRDSGEPGPGAYNILSQRSTGSVRRVSRNGSLSSAERKTGSNFLLSGSGPNATQRSHENLPSLRSSKSFTSLDKSARFKIPAQNQPGPGQYNI